MRRHAVTRTELSLAAFVFSYHVRLSLSNARFRGLNGLTSRFDGVNGGWEGTDTTACDDDFSRQASQSLK